MRRQYPGPNEEFWRGRVSSETNAVIRHMSDARIPLDGLIDADASDPLDQVVGEFDEVQFDPAEMFLLALRENVPARVTGIPDLAEQYARDSSKRSASRFELWGIGRRSEGGQITPRILVGPNQIATGMDANVYIGWDLENKCCVAVKVLRVDHDDRERFLREVELVSRLDHPGIVDYLGHGIAHVPMVYRAKYTDGAVETSAGAEGSGDTVRRPVIVSRFVGDGETLQSQISQIEAVGVAFSLSDVTGFLHQMAEVTKYLESVAIEELGVDGITHRDIKPENILVDETTGDFQLTDFGTASGVLEYVEGRFIGTVAFLSPEVCKGDEADSRSEVFALGVISYMMLTGRHPFCYDYNSVRPWRVLGLNMRSSYIRLRQLFGYPLRGVGDEKLIWPDHVLAIALRKNRSERYRNPSEFARAMDVAQNLAENADGYTFGGDVRYMSPEEDVALDRTSQSEVFSCAVAAYELLTGEHPFYVEEGEDRFSAMAKITSLNPRSLAEFPEIIERYGEDCIAMLDKLFAMALHRQPSMRHASVEAFSRAFGSVVGLHEGNFVDGPDGRREIETWTPGVKYFS